MLNSPLQANPTDDNLNSTSLANNHYQHNQHGSVPHSQQNSLHLHTSDDGAQEGQYSLLLEQPTEVLTGITAHLTPPALLALGQVCRTLSNHVKDDNTWHRAFVCQFLGIGFEVELRADDPRALMMRREFRSWREECVARYPSGGRVSRWARSLTLKYGVISRSFPLTGKILPGYLHTQLAPAPVGAGIGNPNAEFSPDVISCAISSPPNSSTAARVLWGFRNGDVAVMLASRIMDPARRISAEMVRCNVGDEHAATVKDIIWSGSGAVSCSLDGSVKVWEVNIGKHLGIKCRWTSSLPPGITLPEPCIKVAACLEKGIVVALLNNGDLRVWTGLKDTQVPSDSRETISTYSDSVLSHYIHCPCPPSPSTELTVFHTPLALHIDPIRSAVLVAYANEPQFYRVDITKDADNTQERVPITPFGDGKFGVISSILPCFAKNIKKEKDYDYDKELDEDRSFIVVGDKMGVVSVYDWSASTQQYTLPRDDKGKSKSLLTGISPMRTFEAHTDGSSITSLSWNGTTLITGSARGTTHAFDALTFEHLRSFVSPAPRVRTSRGNVNPNVGVNVPIQGNVNQDANNAMAGEGGRDPVSQIVVGDGKETIIVVVGERVMAWQAGKVPKSGTGGVRGRHSGGGLPAKKKRGMGKWLQQMEMHQTITESRQLLELESKNSKRAHGRHKEQTSKLDKLGLSEAEALEYVLMLSREEAAQRRSGDALAHAETLAAATDSMSDLQLQHAIDEGIFEYDFDQEDGNEVFGTGSAEVSGSLSKMPSSASLTSSTGSSDASSRDGIEIPNSRSPSDFPPITPPSVSAASTPAASRRNSWGWHSSSPSSSIMGTQGSPRSSKSTAWGRLIGVESNPPLRGAWSKGSPNNSPPAVRNSPPTRRIATSPIMGAVNEDEMDDDLKFAIELSLAEARSRKQI
ncbi:hypothetical protein BDQ17DRAFT_1351263 [Cyathus striatus]|nr:hypothetical protein BDQ17DRAFT_1351263 [Cyathus striatus]